MPNGLGGYGGSAGSGTPTQIYYELTYAQAASAISGGTVVRGATYFITDRNIELIGAATNAFSPDGRFLRSGQWNAIVYDFGNDHIALEIDSVKKNAVGASYLYVTGILGGTDPRDVFNWSSANCTGNWVQEAIFDCSSATGLVFGNIITNGAEVETSGDGTFANNVFQSTSIVDATSNTGTIQNNTALAGGDFDFSSNTGTIQNNKAEGGGTINATGNDGSISDNYVFYATGTLNCTNNDAAGVVSGNQVFGTLTANSNEANISVNVLNNGSTATVSSRTGDFNANFLTEASTFTASSGSGSVQNNTLKGGCTVNLTDSSTVDNNIFKNNVTYTVAITGANELTNCQFNLNSNFTLVTGDYVDIYFEDTKRNNYEKTFTVASNVINFDQTDSHNWAALGIVNSTSTINTISNLSLAPKRFRLTPTSGNTISFASASATNIELGNGVITVSANGTNGDWLEFEHDGTDAYLVEINNY